MLEFQGQRVRLVTTILNAKEELYLRISLVIGKEFKYTPELVEDVTNGIYIQIIQYLTRRRHGGSSRTYCLRSCPPAADEARRLEQREQR